MGYSFRGFDMRAGVRQVAAVKRVRRYDPCRRCRVRVGYCRRGLCHSCCNVPGVLEAVPVVLNTRTDLRVGGSPPTRPPADPCPHPPGSAGRVETYRARAAAGEFLYHPADAGFEGALP